MSGLGQVFGSKTWSLGSSRFWWLPPSQSWGQGWGWKGRGAWKPKVSFGGLVDNWAWPNGGFNGLRRGNLARNQSLSKRPKLAGPTPFDRQGRRSRPKGANLPGGRGCPGPTMGKAHRCRRFWMILDPTFQELTGHGPPKAQRFNGTKPSIPLQAIVDSINSKPNDNIRNI